jgi:hypothetical protein
MYLTCGGWQVKARRGNLGGNAKSVLEEFLHHAERPGRNVV